MQGVAQRYARGQIEFEKPILASWQALLDYCRAQMAFENIEQFRLLFLDKKNRLIADEVQQKGTVDTRRSIRGRWLKRSLELSATAIIMVHNHLKSLFLVPLVHDLSRLNHHAFFACRTHG